MIAFNFFYYRSPVANNKKNVRWRGDVFARKIVDVFGLSVRVTDEPGSRRESDRSGTGNDKQTRVLFFGRV